jgi:hypothetical protein
LIYTPLEAIDLELKLLVLILEIMQLGLQSQHMRLDRTWRLVPFHLGKWKTPSDMFSLGGGDHDSYPGLFVWI